jgi:F-box protein 21
LHRARAIGLWAALKDENASVLLERMLAAYDMFAEGMEDADCGDVSDLVADVAQRFRNEHPQYEDLTIRERARVLAHFLRAQGFRGAQDVYYDNLPNNFITRCLRDPEHPALPIICVAIYCAVAQRLAINAAPCSFPMHVYAVVSSTDNGVDLNGRAQFSDSSPDSSPDRMYIDAFRPDVEVPLTHLAAQLSSMGASFQDRQTYLGPASHAEIVLRTSRNIMHSVKTAQNRPRTAGVYTDTQGWPDMEDALYAALWVSVLLQQRGEEGARNRMRHHLPFLCELFQNYFPWDASLLEEHILPQLLGVPEYGQMLQILSVVRAADRALKPVVRRDTDGKDKVKYRIGQVFRHRRFRYQGVIIGWDVHCDATEEWMAQMGVGEGRRWQSFYHVL